MNANGRAFRKALNRAVHSDYEWGCHLDVVKRAGLNHWFGETVKSQEGLLGLQWGRRTSVRLEHNGRMTGRIRVGERLCWGWRESLESLTWLLVYADGSVMQTAWCTPVHYRKWWLEKVFVSKISSHYLSLTLPHPFSLSLCFSVKENEMNFLHLPLFDDRGCCLQWG